MDDNTKSRYILFQEAYPEIKSIDRKKVNPSTWLWGVSIEIDEYTETTLIHPDDFENIWELIAAFRPTIERAHRKARAIDRRVTNDPEKMRLWLLQPQQIGVTKWHPAFECAGAVYAHVIRAETEAIARDLAADVAGSEGAQAWLDSSITQCNELPQHGNETIIVTEYNES